MSEEKVAIQIILGILQEQRQIHVRNLKGNLAILTNLAILQIAVVVDIFIRYI